jgi:hypothetical protein
LSWEGRPGPIPLWEGRPGPVPLWEGRPGPIPLWEGRPGPIPLWEGRPGPIPLWEGRPGPKSYGRIRPITAVPSPSWSSEVQMIAYSAEGRGTMTGPAWSPS